MSPMKQGTVKVAEKSEFQTTSPMKQGTVRSSGWEPSPRALGSGSSIWTTVTWCFSSRPSDSISQREAFEIMEEHSPEVKLFLSVPLRRGNTGHFCSKSAGLPHNSGVVLCVDQGTSKLEKQIIEGIALTV